MAACVFLHTTRLLARQELQTINRRFEVRPWLIWSDESLKRLNPQALWDYHQKHEIPRRWWAWDYTLSWLLENNHPPVQNKVVIFNHLLEDEPPAEAIKHHAWMEPLRNHPMNRKDMAGLVDFLAGAGSRLIILDNDFPQYSENDQNLALSIHNASSGRTGGKPVPVLMARTVNRSSSEHVLKLQVPSKPAGVLNWLAELEPGQDIEAKYTGITGILPDDDQVVRRLALTLPGLTGEDHDSIVLKAAALLGLKLPEDVPSVLEIDFAGPPDSNLYPVRPITYLLDPARKKAMVDPPAGSQDVTLDGAIVFIGDGVIDIYDTPSTNEGLNRRSGSEILVHALETLARSNPPRRMEDKFAYPYFALVSLLAGIVWIGWKLAQRACVTVFAGLSGERIIRASSDLVFLFVTIAGFYLIGCMIFAYSGLIVPVFVPCVAIAIGTIGAVLWEREREREEVFLTRLQAAHDKLDLAEKTYEADLKRQEAEARAREVEQDRKRRHEFVRRINHDLNAPVSVLNWTLAELQEESDDETDNSKDKIGRLVKTSDQLCELIDQLVKSYDYEEEDRTESVSCSLTQVLADAVDLQRPLAEMHESRINHKPSDSEIIVRANALELSRVIDNLIRNAIKHNPSGTAVEINLESNGAFHRVSVKDDGKGISAHHLKRIFEPGYRVDPNKEDSQGLGLDIVKTLVERMGGTIEVESMEGKGTTFSILIPVLEVGKDVCKRSSDRSGGDQK